jgi:long-chain acyl-CoA synthetase
MIFTTTLATLPDERAALDPTGACIDDDRLALTNAELLTRVKATATMLRTAGVGPGDVVATMLTNRVELVVVMFAVWRIGAALTPINPSLTAGEAAFQIEDSSSRLVVHEGAALDIDGVTMVDVTTLPASATGANPRSRARPTHWPCSSTRAARPANPRG